MWADDEDEAYDYLYVPSESFGFYDDEFLFPFDPEVNELLDGENDDEDTDEVDDGVVLYKYSASFNADN